MWLVARVLLLCERALRDGGSTLLVVFLCATPPISPPFPGVFKYHIADPKVPENVFELQPATADGSSYVTSQRPVHLSTALWVCKTVVQTSTVL